MNIQQVEEYMHQRIRLFLANGGTLTSCGFGDGEKCRCAVTACDLSAETTSSQGLAQWVCDTGLTEGAAWAVINGFDGNDPDTYESIYRDPPLYDLGQRLAAEYL